jgi:hypothetical protein
MNPNKIIGAYAVAIAPVVITIELAHKAKEKIRSTYVDAKCELANRQGYDKIHNYTRSSKKK